MTIAERGVERDIHAVVSSGGSFGASSLEQELGLGAADAIESLEIHWPASGVNQTFQNVPLSTALEIREDADSYRVRELPRIEFGDADK